MARSRQKEPEAQAESVKSERLEPDTSVVPETDESVEPEEVVVNVRSRRRQRRQAGARVLDSAQFNAIASQNQWTKELVNPSKLNTMTDLDFVEIRIDTMYGALNKITGAHMDDKGVYQPGDYQVVVDLLTNYKEDKISWGRQGRKEVLQGIKPAVRFIPGAGAIMPHDNEDDEGKPAEKKPGLFDRFKFWKKR